MAEAYRSLLQREKHSRSKLQYGFSEYDLLAYKRLRSSSVIQHDGCINTIRWSSADNGRYMVTGSDDTSVKIWDCRDYLHDVTLAAEVETGHQRNIFCAEMCPEDANKVVSCAADGTVRMNDIYGSGRTGSMSSGEDILTSSYSIAHMFRFDVSNPHVLYVCEERGQLLRIDTRSGNDNRTIYSAPKLSYSVKACAQSAAFGSQYLFVGGSGFVIRQLDLRRLETNGTGISEGGGYSSDDSESDLPAVPRTESPALVAKFSPHGLSRNGRSAVQFKFKGSTRSVDDQAQCNRTFDACTSSAFGHQRASGIRSGLMSWDKSSFTKSDQHVSVSGMEISGDGSTLLASYQSDQIYTFPLDTQLQVRQEDQGMGQESGHANDDDGGSRAWSPYWDGHPTYHDLKTDATSPYIGAEQAFGGHINYATFLKQVSFFGPRDEYILTGSDSGHIYIFDRKQGGHLPPLHQPPSTRVTRLMNVLVGDARTVNGVISHPSLPLFASYGIDSDAKLWAYCEKDYEEEGDATGSDNMAGMVRVSIGDLREDNGVDVVETGGPAAAVQAVGHSPSALKKPASRGTICSIHCELPLQWNRLDAKRMHYSGSTSLYHRERLEWSRSRSRDAQGEAFARDRRVFDQASFHDSIHGILRDLSRRGIVGYGTKAANTFITHRVPGRDPLPGPAGLYDMTLTKPFDLVHSLAQQEQLFGHDELWFWWRRTPVDGATPLLRAGRGKGDAYGYGDGDDDGNSDSDESTFAAIARIVMDPRAMPRHVAVQSLLDTSLRFAEADHGGVKPPTPDLHPAPGVDYPHGFHLGVDVNPEIQTHLHPTRGAGVVSSEVAEAIARVVAGGEDPGQSGFGCEELLPCAREMMALFGLPYLNIVFVAQRLLFASERLKTNGSLALKAGEAGLALVFYSRAASFADYVLDHVTGPAGKAGEVPAYIMHDQQIAGFVSAAWRCALYPPEGSEGDTHGGGGRGRDSERYSEEHVERVLLRMAELSVLVSAEDEEEQQEEDKERVREEQEAMMMDDAAAQPSTRPPASAQAQAQAQAQVDTPGAGPLKRAKVVGADGEASSPAGSAGAGAGAGGRRADTTWGLGRKEEALMRQRNHLISHADTIRKWKQATVYFIMLQARSLRFQAMNNLVQGLVTLKQHSSVCVLGLELGAFGRLMLDGIRENTTRLEKEKEKEAQQQQQQAGTVPSLLQAAIDRERACADTWARGLLKLWFRVGCSQLILKRFDDAKASLERAAQLDPSDALVARKLKIARDHVKRIDQKQARRLESAFRAAAQRAAAGTENADEGDA